MLNDSLIHDAHARDKAEREHTVKGAVLDPLSWGKGVPCSVVYSLTTHSYGSGSPERLSIVLSTTTDIAMVTEALKPWEILVLVTSSTTIDLRQCPFLQTLLQSYKIT